MKPTNESPDLKDDDIRALLDARPPTSSPADLDARILAAAKAEVQTENGVQTRSLSHYGSWLAVAAVFVLAVILVPIMQQTSETPREAFSPEVSLNDAALPTSGVGVSEALDVTEESRTASGDLLQSDSLLVTAPVTTELNLAQEESAEKKEGARLLAEEQQQNERVTVRSDINTSAIATAKARERTASRKDSAASVEVAEDISDIDAMTDEEIRQTFLSHPYRRDRALWLDEIQRLERLEEAGRTVSARTAVV